MSKQSSSLRWFHDPSGHSARERINEIRRIVLDWYRCNGRDFPWRASPSPYRVLVAEVLLRQTQAFRVVGTFTKIVQQYPSPPFLADARPERLREDFRALGLVKRADNLVAIGRQICAEHGGEVPADFDALVSLPGVGRYGANSILCLGFGKPLAMVDGGVARLLRRVLGMYSIKKGPDSTVWGLAEAIVPFDSSADFNLGLLDLATQMCKPKFPLCTGCPLSTACHHALSNQN